MEGVREFIDASKLVSVISLPETLKNRKLEIIVLPAEENTRKVMQDNHVEDIVAQHWKKKTRNKEDKSEKYEE